jgi:hypothetical protein
MLNPNTDPDEYLLILDGLFVHSWDQLSPRVDQPFQVVDCGLRPPLRPASRASSEVKR